MAETDLARMGVRQWSADTDTPDRGEFNTSFANINERAAYDDGATFTAVPVTNVVQGRYAMLRQAASPYFTLYRRSAASAWDAVGGNTDPTTRYFRNADSAAKAWEAADTDLTNPSAWVTYGGDGVLSGRLALLDQNPSGSSRGAVYVGSSAAYAPTTLGRAYVRTVDSGDRGLVLDAHADAAGMLLAARRNGGQDLFTVDSQARMQTRAPSSFGAADLNAAVGLAGAPGAAGALTTGLFLHGQSGDTTRYLFNAQRFQPGGTDSGSIFAIQPNKVQVGRSGAWTNGAQVVIGAPAILHYGPSSWYLAESDADSANTATAARMSFKSTGLLATTGLAIENRGNRDVGTIATVYMYPRTGGAWSGYLQEWVASKNETGDGLTVSHEVMSRLRFDGRLETNAPWKGSGDRPHNLRDARQPLVHIAAVAHVDPGAGVNEGVALAPAAFAAQTWPAMTPRSVGTFDLCIDVDVEALAIFPSGTSTADAQVLNIKLEIRAGAGAYSLIGSQETVLTTPGTDHRPGGDRPVFHFQVADLSPSTTFQVKTTITCGGAAAQLRIRNQQIRATECLLSTYA